MTATLQARIGRELLGLNRPRRWASPGDLAKVITPKTVQTPALDLIDAALVDVLDRPDGRLIITMAPQEGKSQRVAHDFIVWWLKEHPSTRIVTASYGQELANRNGLAVRRTISAHPELGMPGGPLVVSAIAAKLSDFSYDAVRYGQLSRSAWDAYSYDTAFGYW